MSRAWSAISEAAAAHLLPAFRAAKASGFQSLRFRGEWRNRRFVIVDGRPLPTPPPEIPDNPIHYTLTLPCDIDAASLAKRCRSFGGVVERLERDRKRGTFERVVSADDAARHIVHVYHHVALCGHRSRRWLSDDEVASVAEDAIVCNLCEIVASTPPKHRARYHPAVASNRP